MNDPTRRLKIAEKIVRVRQQQLDQEVAALSDIRKRKVEIQQEMHEAWKQYMDGVDRINKLRTKGQGGMLEAMEKGLDLVKDRWVDGLNRVKQIELAEQAQLRRVQAMQGELKKSEKLEERSQVQVRDVEKRKDQKVMDEYASRRFQTARG